MSPPSARRSWTLSLLAFAAFACASRAAAAGNARTPSAAEDLSRGAGGAEDFKRYIDGSREGQGDVGAPDVLARGDGRGESPPYRLSRAARSARPEDSIVPLVEAAAADRSEAPSRDVRTSDLRKRKIAAVLGLGLLFIAGSWLEAPREAEADAEGAAEPTLPVPRPAPARFAAPESATKPSRLAEARAEPDFIDTLMPAPTWRAISWREQCLIESWDASPEKASASASLIEWLDDRGAAEGVDIRLLKAKIFREA